jgi:pimeloyl-ACP methyl ester carboxylesterase
MTVPLAIFNGAEDPLIRTTYFDALEMPSLWRHGVVAVPGQGHAPFLHDPATVNPLLAEFAGAV